MRLPALSSRSPRPGTAAETRLSEPRNELRASSFLPSAGGSSQSSAGRVRSSCGPLRTPANWHNRMATWFVSQNLQRPDGKGSPRAYVGERAGTNRNKNVAQRTARASRLVIPPQWVCRRRVRNRARDARPRSDPDHVMPIDLDRASSLSSCLCRSERRWSRCSRSVAAPNGRRSRVRGQRLALPSSSPAHRHRRRTEGEKSPVASRSPVEPPWAPRFL